MLTIEKTVLPSPEQWEIIIEGMRNPMNSWDKSDSHYDENGSFVVGQTDLDLGHRLATAGSDHRKFLRQIMVSMDITAPLYWWKEFDTYKVGTVANLTTSLTRLNSSVPREK